MKVLIATAHRSIVGGVETYLRALLPLVCGRGIEIGLLTAHPPVAGGADITDRCPESVTIVPDLPAAFAYRPDVVFTHDLPDPSADAALTEQFACVRYVHNYVGGCVSGTKCHAAPAWQACTRPFGPACLALYLPRRCGGLNPVTALRLYNSNRSRQRSLGDYRSILVASHHMAAEVARNGADPSSVSTVPYFPPGIGRDALAPENRARTGRVLFIGRITAMKGWRELLAAIPVAAARLSRPLTLVVAGDGPDRGAFETEAARRGVRADFLGWVGAERRVAEMRAADVLAVPSVWPEPFGIVGIEAGCVGLPAVGFATGGIPDWLVPGVSGESAPGERPRADELAAALVRALADDDYLQRLRVGAWETAGKFTAGAHLDRLIPVLRAAAAAGPVAPRPSAARK